jgi:hypothetical protein
MRLVDARRRMPFFAQGWRGAASDLTVPMMQTCAFSNAHPVLSIWPPSIIQWQQIAVLYSLQGQSRTLDLKLSPRVAEARARICPAESPASSARGLRPGDGGVAAGIVLPRRRNEAKETARREDAAKRRRRLSERDRAAAPALDGVQTASQQHHRPLCRGSSSTRRSKSCPRVLPLQLEKIDRQSAGARLLLFFVVAPVVFGHQVEESLIRA